MALINRISAKQLKTPPFMGPLQKIAIAEHFIQKIQQYHTVERVSVHNSQYAERDRYTGAVVVDGGRRIYQVVARPVLISTIAQAVRPFCWQRNNCKESEINSRLRRECRQFSTEIKSTKRKMVNLIIIYFTCCVIW